MAGTYPDAPSNRIAWDVDAIVLGNNSQYPLSTARALNSDSAAYALGVGLFTGMSWVVIFPRKLDLTGYFYGAADYGGFGSTGPAYWSTDTTNGVDGTWTAWSAPNYGAASLVTQRSNITVNTLLGIKAFRGSYSGGRDGAYLQHLHLYGKYASTENTDRLEIWHPTLDQRVGGAFFDWGDITRGSTADRTFRVKNISDIYTANNITVSIESLTDTTPSFAGSFMFSTGGSFTSTVNIGNLLPSQTSGLITVRRTTPANAVLSLWNARMSAAAATWS